MKNKKQKTKPLNILLFELVAKAMLGNDSVAIEQTEKQIKQLIADEVIGGDEPQYHYLRRMGEMPDDQEGFLETLRVEGRNILREQQRKKLERI